MSKTLDDMTYNELRAERSKYVADQKTASGDYSWWGVQGQIDNVDAADEQLFKETMKHLYARYGVNKTIGYLQKLEEARHRAEALKKAEKEL